MIPQNFVVIFDNLRKENGADKATIKSQNRK